MVKSKLESRQKRRKVNLKSSLCRVLSDSSGNFETTYKSNVKFLGDDFSFRQQPFKFAQIYNVFRNEKFIQALEDEICDVSFNVKSNDLYCFRQSSDLKRLLPEEFPALSEFINALRSNVKPFLESVTNKQLNGQIAVTCSKYCCGDYLLCHDDKLEGRQIAFIYYLTPPDWDIQKDGGSLDLFDCDSNNLPLNIVERLCPNRNALSFFEVTPQSFHQVAEVTRVEGHRLSINGWFTCETGNATSDPESFTPIPTTTALTLAPSDIKESEFLEWLNTSYLVEETLDNISKQFDQLRKSNSHENIILPKIFSPSKISEVVKSLNNFASQEKAKSFLPEGRANRRCCSVLPISTSDILSRSNPVESLLFFLTSDAFLVLLSQMTGYSWLDVSGATGNIDTSIGCKFAEVRMWSPGSYSLLKDTDIGVESESLSIHYFLMADDKQENLKKNITDENVVLSNCADPGSVVYIEKYKEEPVTIIDPTHNALAIIGAPTGEKPNELLHFNRYMNKVLFGDQKYFEFYLVFGKRN